MRPGSSDLLRGSIVCRSIDDFGACFRGLAQLEVDGSGVATIETIKNSVRDGREPDSGYMDANVILRFDGFLVEVQLQLEAIYEDGSWQPRRARTRVRRPRARPHPSGALAEPGRGRRDLSRRIMTPRPPPPRRRAPDDRWRCSMTRVDAFVGSTDGRRGDVRAHFASSPSRTCRRGGFAALRARLSMRTFASTTMKHMFLGASSFIGVWSVDNVISMASMFRVARAFNQDIGGWAVHSVMTMQGISKPVALGGRHALCLKRGLGGRISGKDVQRRLGLRPGPRLTTSPQAPSNAPSISSCTRMPPDGIIIPINNEVRHAKPRAVPRRRARPRRPAPRRAASRRPWRWRRRAPAGTGRRPARRRPPSRAPAARRRRSRTAPMGGRRAISDPLQSAVDATRVKAASDSRLRSTKAPSPAVDRPDSRYKGQRPVGLRPLAREALRQGPRPGTRAFHVRRALGRRRRPDAVDARQPELEDAASSGDRGPASSPRLLSPLEWFHGRGAVDHGVRPEDDSVAVLFVPRPRTGPRASRTSARLAPRTT